MQKIKQNEAIVRRPIIITTYWDLLSPICLSYKGLQYDANIMHSIGTINVFDVLVKYGNPLYAK